MSTNNSIAANRISEKTVSQKTIAEKTRVEKIVNLNSNADNSQQTLQSPQLTTQSGAWAGLSNEDGSERLQVYSANNELIFEFDPEKGITRVVIPTGDLELATTNGNIKLAAAKDVVIDGEHIDLNANTQLSLNVINTAKDLLRPIGSSIRLLPEKMKIGSQQFDLAAQQVRANIQEMRYRGERIDGTNKKCGHPYVLRRSELPISLACR